MRRSFKLISLLVFSLYFLNCSSGVRKSDPSLEYFAPGEHFIQELTGDLQVHRFQLKNGLMLLVLEDHRSPTLAYQTWFKVGSRDEAIGKTGLAHLFEHLMFKATKNHPAGDFDRILQLAGAEDTNAFTSRDFTAYVQEIPSDKLELLIQLESDRMVGLEVSDTAFTSEREVVQNERRYRTENSPEGLIEQELFELAFKTQSYRWPIIGYEADLTSMKSQDARDFYVKHYSPDHAAIVVVGDVSPKNVYSLVKKYYEAIPAKNGSEIRAISQAEIPHPTPLRKKLTLNIQVERLMMGYPMPSVQSPDLPALWVLQNILVGGKSARLNRALVNSGIAQGIGGGTLEGIDSSLFIFSVPLQKNKRASQAEAVILRELSLLQKTPVGLEELERAKNEIEFEFYESLDTNSERANFIGQFESLSGSFEKGLQTHKLVKSVQAADLQRMIEKYFQPGLRTVLSGVPK